MQLALTDHTQKIIVQDSRDIAVKFHHKQISPEHFLLALLQDDSNNAVEALRHFKLELRYLTEEILKSITTLPKWDEDEDTQNTRLSHQAVKVVECAREEAHTMGHNYVGAEHILLGLIRDGEGMAYRLLHAHGITLTRARKEVWMVLNSKSAAATSGTAKNLQGAFTEEAGARIEENLAPSIHPDIKDILIQDKQIAKRVKDLSKLISKDYAGKEPLLISVLKGSIFFLTDLLRELTIDCRFDLMTVSSYGDKTVSSGKVKLVMDLKQEVKGQDVIIVEDIFDTGKTLHYIIEHIKERDPASIKVCVLLSKKRVHEVELVPEYVGFEIPEEFVVGYGLDYAEKYRHLPYIAVLKPEIYTNKD